MSRIIEVIAAPGSCTSRPEAACSGRLAAHLSIAELAPQPGLHLRRTHYSQAHREHPHAGPCAGTQCPDACSKHHKQQGSTHQEPQSWPPSTWLRTGGTLPSTDQSTQSSGGNSGAELAARRRRACTCCMSWGWMPRISSLRASSSGVKSLQRGLVGKHVSVLTRLDTAKTARRAACRNSLLER